ncbi:hypothetical protein C8Q76DRAFT_327874 [Earliella scabrosa]|nr:hypothetical protein C8Q76DRAFT_327874 [Earliella scabrosa]
MIASRGSHAARSVSALTRGPRCRRPSWKSRKRSSSSSRRGRRRTRARRPNAPRRARARRSRRARRLSRPRLRPSHRRRRPSRRTRAARTPTPKRASRRKRSPRRPPRVARTLKSGSLSRRSSSNRSRRPRTRPLLRMHKREGRGYASLTSNLPSLAGGPDDPRRSPGCRLLSVSWCTVLWFSLVDVECSDAPMLSLDPDVQSIPLPAPSVPLPQPLPRSRARWSPHRCSLPTLLCTYDIHATLRFVVMMYPGCTLSLALF